MRIMFVLAATGAGAAIGWLCGVVPIWPVARIAAASVIGFFVGAVGALAFVFLSLSRSGSGGMGAVSFGLTEVMLLGVPTIALMAVVGVFALRWMGWSAATVAKYGPVFCGGGAALVAALWITQGLTTSGSH